MSSYLVSTLEQHDSTSDTADMGKYQACSFSLIPICLYDGNLSEHTHVTFQFILFMVHARKLALSKALVSTYTMYYITGLIKFINSILKLIVFLTIHWNSIFIFLCVKQ